MTTLDLIVDDQDGLDYLRGLACGLGAEISSRAEVKEKAGTLAERAGEFVSACEKAEGRLSFVGWMRLWSEYKSLASEMASVLNQLASVSRVYNSMEDFWADAEKQAAGISPYTFWDTYEHGRRRQLEALLARCYGAESALLLNSGMSAIAVGVGMESLKTGEVIATGTRSYFETTEYLNRYVSSTGVQVERLPLEDTDATVARLEQLKPKIMIVETATNAPDATVPRGIFRFMQASPSTLFLLDNSVQSHLTRWFQLPRPQGARLLVLESAVKYLTHECMAGVVYGDVGLVDKARAYARSSGQQLQEKAFNYIREAEIRALDCKLRLHARNVRAFCGGLTGSRECWEYVRSLDSSAAEDPDARLLFANGAGCLVYLSLRHRDGDGLRQMHRDLVSEWRVELRRLGLTLPIRAGFGWNPTSARVYESSYLNQPDAPSYIRVSVGIEPEAIIEMIVTALAEAALSIAGSDTKVFYART